MLTETLLRIPFSWLMFSRADLTLAAGKNVQESNLAPLGVNFLDARLKYSISFVKPWNWNFLFLINALTAW
jgi:hypothetical protein